MTVAYEEQYAKAHSDLAARVYLSVGTEEAPPEFDHFFHAVGNVAEFEKRLTGEEVSLPATQTQPRIRRSYYLKIWRIDEGVEIYFREGGDCLKFMPCFIFRPVNFREAHMEAIAVDACADLLLVVILLKMQVIEFSTLIGNESIVVLPRFVTRLFPSCIIWQYITLLFYTS